MELTLKLGESLPVVEVMLRLIMALACGAVLGLDRQYRHKATGLRTLSLVAVGSAATTLIAIQMAASSTVSGEAANIDPTRVIQGLAQAVGFVSAGIIIRSGSGDVHGATTAVVIWIASALGIACAAGFYVIAGMTLVLSLFVTTVLGLVERQIFKKLGEPPA